MCPETAPSASEICKLHAIFFCPNKRQQIQEAQAVATRIQTTKKRWAAKSAGLGVILAGCVSQDGHPWHDHLVKIQGTHVNLAILNS